MVRGGIFPCRHHRQWRILQPQHGRAQTQGFGDQSACGFPPPPQAPPLQARPQEQVAQIELVGSEYNPKAVQEDAAEKDADKPKTKGVGDRLRETAKRIRGDRADKGASKAQAKGQTRGATRKTTTPRKAGGS